jgi:protein TonB
LISVGLLELSRPEPATKPNLPLPKPKVQKITPPRLISKPELIETPPLISPGNAKEEVREPEKPAVEPLRAAPLPREAGPVPGGGSQDDFTVAGRGSGSAGDTGDFTLAGAGDGLEVGGDGRSGSGRGQGLKGAGGGLGEGDALTAFARPLGGYQVKPRYPDSARRAGAQGTTLLKLRVLENGKVGNVEIERSAGHRDLDTAAAEAVKKWLFEPARMGKEPVAVWVLLPVRFELQ